MSNNESEARTLKMLPDYTGEYEAKSEVLSIPSLSYSAEEEKDTSKLQALMSTLVTCTISLADLLKVRPNLLGIIAGFPKIKDFCMKENIKKPPGLKPRKPLQKPLQINKVLFKGVRSKEVGNTVRHKYTTSIAILDTRAGISIATKAIWENGGKQALRKTQMVLQLAGGNLEKPLGLLENIGGPMLRH